MKNEQPLICGENIRQLRAELLKQLGTDSEADQLLEYVLQRPRSYLYAYAEEPIATMNKHRLNTLLQNRLNGMPLAYLTGKCEFFSLELTVSPQVLIPRPETELLVELIIESAPAGGQILDLGCGCGNIAIAVAHHRLDLTVIAVDISPAALSIAQKNAATHNISRIEWLHSDWFSALDRYQFDYIVANPPYVGINDTALDSDVAAHEPAVALFAEDDGLACLRTIIEQASDYLYPNSTLAVEHGYRQADDVATLMNTNGLTSVISLNDTAGLPRVTLGKKL